MSEMYEEDTSRIAYEDMDVRADPRILPSSSEHPNLPTSFTSTHILPIEHIVSGYS